MINYDSQYQLKFDEFSALYQLNLDPQNRWIQLGSILPWDSMVTKWMKHYDIHQGTKGISPRVLIGAMIIKHKLKSTDTETIQSIQENPYMQFFLGMQEFNPKAVFSPTLFVDLRKRVGADTFDLFSEMIIKISQIDQSDKTHHGELKIDATVADQQIRYPNDLGLLSEARVKTEIMVDLLFNQLREELSVKPRTYRKQAHKIYLSQAKKKKKSKKELRKALRNGLNCVKRNLGHIDKMMNMVQVKNGASRFALDHKYQKQLWVIHTLYEQQWDMFINHRHRCPDRIVSISQPHVRPIVRGKQAAMVEFGSKLGLSVFNGYIKADHISWDAYHEAQDLIQQAENYKTLLGYYPEAILADKLYATNQNRKWCTDKGIKLTATPKGKQPKKTAYMKRKEKLRYGRRNHVEGKIGNAKQAYNLNQIKAKLKRTSESWIGATLFVMNLSQFALDNGATF